MLAKEFKKIVTDTIKEVANETFQKVNSDITHGLIDLPGSGTLEIVENGFTISFSGDEWAWIEFGTGNQNTVKNGISAKDYLNDKPTWLKDDAMQFYKNGMGGIAAHPFLYPNMIKAWDELPKRIDSNLQKYFDSYVIK